MMNTVEIIEKLAIYSKLLGALGTFIFLVSSFIRMLHTNKLVVFPGVIEKKKKTCFETWQKCTMIVRTKLNKHESSVSLYGMTKQMWFIVRSQGQYLSQEDSRQHLCNTVYFVFGLAYKNFSLHNVWTLFLYLCCVQRFFVYLLVSVAKVILFSLQCWCL